MTVRQVCVRSRRGEWSHHWCVSSFSANSHTALCSATLCCPASCCCCCPAAKCWRATTCVCGCHYQCHWPLSVILIALRWIHIDTGMSPSTSKCCTIL